MKVRYLLVTGDVLRESEQAVLMSIGGEEHWVPKSQIDPDSHSIIEDATEGDEIEIYVREWLVREKGLANV